MPARIGNICHMWLGRHWSHPSNPKFCYKLFNANDHDFASMFVSGISHLLFINCIHTGTVLITDCSLDSENNWFLQLVQSSKFKDPYNAIYPDPRGLIKCWLAMGEWRLCYKVMPAFFLESVIYYSLITTTYKYQLIGIPAYRVRNTNHINY